MWPGENRGLTCFTDLANDFTGDRIFMGKLLMMPRPEAHVSVHSNSGAGDLELWLSAPREGNASYAAVYSAVSLAMQSALRQWVGEWLKQNPDALERKVSGYSLLAFSCTRPYRGRSTNVFTYDPQQTTAVDHAIRAAGRMVAEQITCITSLRKTAGGRIIPSQVTQFVSQKRRNLYRMFHVETLLMDEILKFTQINIPKLGLQKAAAELRMAFEKHLHRFADEFDMADRSNELLAIATDALRTRPAKQDEMPIAA
jgi:hypothetical protein